MPDTERRAWVGCIGCYNAGLLIGEWFAATDVPTVMDGSEDAFNQRVTHLPRLHFAEGHEELWTYDHEGLPITGEMNPGTVQRIAEVCDAIENDTSTHAEVAAVRAWAQNQGEDFPTEWDAPTRNAFEDAFCGTFESFKDYASEYVCEVGWSGFDGDEITRIFPYLDMDLIARELDQEYYTDPAPEGGVYVFRSL